MLLVAGLIFFMTRKRGKKKVSAEVPDGSALLPGGGENPALPVASIEAQIEAQMAEREEEQRKADIAALASIKVPPVKTKKSEVLVKQIPGNVKERFDLVRKRTAGVDSREMRTEPQL